MGPLLFLMLICVSVSAKTDPAKERKLLFVEMLFRHGDRAPLFLYPTDPNSLDNWPEGMGELTQLGKLQQYTVGKFLRSRYADFITSNPAEVVVNSTLFNRCMNSAMSRLAALYAPTEPFQFVEGFDWQPIPVYYTEPHKDRILNVGSDCPRAYAEYERISDTKEFRDAFAPYQNMLENVMNRSDLHDWDSLIILHDTLKIEKKLGLEIPDWVDQYYQQLSDFSDLYVYTVFDSELMHQFRAGPFYENIVYNMNRKIKGEIPNQKFQLYSAHDANIMVILQSINLWQGRPPYCSTIVFELYELPDGQHEVRLLYLNSTSPEVEETLFAHPLVLEGCTEYCPFEYFLEYTKHLIPDDWERLCELEGWPDWKDVIKWWQD